MFSRLAKALALVAVGPVAAQSEVEGLKLRVATLEQRVAAMTDQRCPRCRSLSYRVRSSDGDGNDWRICQTCGYADQPDGPSAPVALSGR